MELIKACAFITALLMRLFCPLSLDFNREHVGDKYQRLNTALGIAQNDDSADFIRSLNNRIGLPANLSEMGVNSDSIPSLADLQ